MPNDSPISAAPTTTEAGARRIPLATPIAVMILVLAAGCQAPAAAPSSASEVAPGDESPRATASGTVPASASEVAGACLDEDVMDAVDQVRTGDLDTEPPIAEVADALDALELEGRSDEVRDGLVGALRASPTDPDAIVFLATTFWAEVPVAEC